MKMVMNDLYKAAKKLVDQMEKIHNDPAYLSVFVVAANHHCTYNGLNYLQELNELKTVLKEIDDSKSISRLSFSKEI